MRFCGVAKGRGMPSVSFFFLFFFWCFFVFKKWFSVFVFGGVILSFFTRFFFFVFVFVLFLFVIVSFVIKWTFIILQAFVSTLVRVCLSGWRGQLNWY